jgi:hypothetical protein
LGDKEAPHFFLDFPLNFPSNFSRKGMGLPAALRFSAGAGGRRGMVSALVSLLRLCAGGGEWYAKEAELAS